jgi:hypothetical protein
MREEWRTVEDWPYEVSDYGRVRRTGAGRGTRVGKVLRPVNCGSGYFYVGLSQDGVVRRVTVHTLVAAAFIGPRPLGCEVNHRNAKKLDNTATNLEYVTAAGNVAHAEANGLARRHSKLTPDAARDIRAALATGATPKALGTAYGVSADTIRLIRSGKRW